MLVSFLTVEKITGLQLYGGWQQADVGGSSHAPHSDYESVLCSITCAEYIKKPSVSSQRVMMRRAYCDLRTCSHVSTSRLLVVYSLESTCTHLVNKHHYLARLHTYSVHSSVLTLVLPILVTAFGPGLHYESIYSQFRTVHSTAK